ncbi:hypothetical protein BDF21DRAFT_404654 [Thamnidium elegans]|nr:hypothetical protein BDF21DRAFT_404654 [Thamnidium elegans]
MASNAGIKKLRNSYSESLEMFDQVFDLKKYGYKKSGRKHILTAFIGHDSNKHQVRRCSDLERRCYTASRRRQNHVDNQEPSPFAFYDYQDRQQASIEVANIILNDGGEKMKPLKLSNGINVNVIPECG